MKGRWFFEVLPFRNLKIERAACENDVCLFLFLPNTVHVYRTLSVLHAELFSQFPHPPFQLYQDHRPLRHIFFSHPKQNSKMKPLSYQLIMAEQDSSIGPRDKN